MIPSLFLKFLREYWLFALLASALLLGEVSPTNCAAQSGNVEQSAAQPQAAQPRDAKSPEAQPAEPEAPVPNPASSYDASIFQKPIPADQFTFLSRFAGAPSKNLIRDKQYRKLIKGVIPDCIFHYGWDMTLSDALEKVLQGSNQPVQIRDGRFLTLSGSNGPYLSGRGFVWIDMRDGIALGGFYFHPTNGEPTPTVTVFSRQIKEVSLRMSQLPPAFAEDLSQWAAESNIPAVTTRYFITGSNQKILLEHDEDDCRATPANDRSY